MSGLPALTQKVGPLPLGVWLAGGVGGVGMILYRRSKGTSAPAAAPTQQDLTGGNPLSDDSGGVGTGALQFQTPVSSTPTSTAPTTNQEWYTAVFTALVAKNYSPALVDAALRRYLNEQQLSASDWVIVNQALGIYPLPDPLGGGDDPPVTTPVTPPPKTTIPGKPIVDKLPSVPLPPTQASPPKKQPTQAQVGNYLQTLANLAKTRPKTYTVKAGDTLATIAGRFYGNTALWGNLYNANRNKITNPSALIPGTVITLPANAYAN